MSAESLRVIITGTGGRLGGALARRLRQQHRVVAYDRKAMDLRDPHRIADHLTALEFDVLINCAAVTSLDYCEKHPAEAAEVNARAPELMAGHCAGRGARMLHMSTDYVYDGSHPGLRREEETAQPLGVYARTKRAGEEAVLAASAANIVARSSWIFGPDRPCFVDQMLERARRGEPCEAIADKWSGCSYSHDAADALAELMRHPGAGGVVNLSNDGTCSWHEWAAAAFRIAGELGIPLLTKEVQPVGLATMEQFIAPRPLHTSMSVDRLATLLGRRPRHWQDALRDYLQTYYC